jgi:hypothetical protein
LFIIVVGFGYVGIDEPLILQYDAKTNIVNIGDKVFITPFPANSFKENALKQQKRTYPVDYGNLFEEQLFFSKAMILSS